MRVTNEGRHREREAIHRDMAAVTQGCSTFDLSAEFRRATIPHAPIQDIPAVREMAAISDKLTSTHTPAGKLVRMQPAAVDIAGAPSDFSFPAKYGQHTLAVLGEAGYAHEEVMRLERDRIVATGAAPH